MAYTFDISDNRRIVEALKTGDEETFKEVYTAFCAPLRHYATTILQNEQAAYEVVQDVFTAVWLNRKRLDAAKPLRNYLLRAVHNNSLRLLKYDEARRRREISAAAELHGGWDQEKEVPPPELAPAISRLPEPQSAADELLGKQEERSDSHRTLHLRANGGDYFVQSSEEIARRNQKKVKKQYVVFGFTVFMG